MPKSETVSRTARYLVPNNIKCRDLVALTLLRQTKAFAQPHTLGMLSRMEKKMRIVDKTDLHAGIGPFILPDG